MRANWRSGSARDSCSRAGHALTLSVREFELLVAMARRPGAIITRDELYDSVWGGQLRAGDRSVDVYVSKLRGKLESAMPDRRFIHTHPGFGYRFQPQQATATGRLSAGAQRAAPASSADADASPLSRDLHIEHARCLTDCTRTSASDSAREPREPSTANRVRGDVVIKNKIGALAGVAVLALGLAACGSSSKSSSSSSSGSSATISGAGSTFAAPVYEQWASSLSPLTVNYQAVGSGAGITALWRPRPWTSAPATRR